MDERGTVLEGRYFGLATDEYLQGEIREQLEILRMRRRAYTHARPPVDPAGRIVIIVDDGVATGSSMLAAIQAIRAQKPQKLIVAIGLAPVDTLERLRREADEVVCLYAAEDFYAVGQFFEDFSEVTDDMVIEELRRHQSAGARGSAPRAGASRHQT